MWSICYGLLLGLFSILGYLYLTNFGFDFYADRDWYVNAGHALMAGNLRPDILLFSPLHSIFTALDDSILNYLTASATLYYTIVRRAFMAFLLGCLIYHFSFAASSLLQLKGCFWRHLTALALVLNPYVIRYSSGVYPEYYSLCLGIFVTYKLLSSSTTSTSTASNDYLFTIITDSKYYKYLFLIFIIVLAFFRYSLFIYILCYFATVFISYRTSSSSAIMSKYIVFALLFVSSVILAFAFRSFFNYHLFALFDCSSFQIPVLLIGFREAFWSSSANCLPDFSFSTFMDRFSAIGVKTSILNYISSIALGLFTSIFSILGLFGCLQYSSRNLSYYVFFSFFMTIIISLFIGVGHYRYLAPLVPSLALGFTLLMYNYFYRFNLYR